MYDAAAAATAAAADGPHDHAAGGSDSAALTAAPPATAPPSSGAAGPSAAGAPAQPGGGFTGNADPITTAAPDAAAPREIVFIDAKVPDRQTLIDGVAAADRVYVLDAGRDGLQQIADILAAEQLSGLNAIQIVSHGFAGEIELGTTILNGSTITRHADALARIGAALQSGGDILLYGCDTAAGAAGASFLADFAAYTGANVAAATHDVGAAARGGSWALDAAIGPIEADLPFTAAALAAYDGILADTLAAGDIAIIGYNTHQTDTSPATTSDSFSFVLMRDITAGTAITFTDQGWTGSGFSAFAGDGAFVWTAASDLSVGTVVTPTISGMSLDFAGDQIIAYQGSALSPTFIYAVDFADGNTGFAGSATDASTSALPTGLTLGTSAVAIGYDSAAYSGPTTGTAAGLRTAIGAASEWVGADRTTLNALVQPVQSGPFFLAPDLQVWAAAASGGNGIAHVDADGTVSGGTSGYNLVQLLTNVDLSVITSGGTVSEKLFHPNDIVLDTVHDLFFVADSGTTVTGNRVLQGQISDLLKNPGAALTVREIYDDPTLTVTTSVNPYIGNLVVDPDSRLVYFTHGSRLEKVTYDTVGQSATTLLNLNNKNGLDFVSGDNTITNNNITDFTVDFDSGDIYMTSSRVVAGLFSKNYMYHVAGLSSSSGAGSLQGSISVMSFSPDDSDIGQLALIGGEAFPEMKGALGGLTIDTAADVLYFSTQTVSLDIDGLPITPLVTFRGGIYSYALTGNPSGTYDLIYQQTAGSGPQGQFNADLEIDTVAGRYYAETSGDDTGIWSGSLASSGSSTLFANPTNIDGLAATGLTLEHAPTLSVSDAGASYVEQQSSPTAVQLISTATASDTDTAALDDQLASATASISSGFLAGVDGLTINGTASGTLDYGTQDITYSYNASTGVMTLSGASTFANYQTSLALIRFQATGDNPTSSGTNTSRTITWSVSDGALSSADVTTTVAIEGVNDAPVNAMPGTQAATEDVGKIITGLAVSDADGDPATQSMRVTLSVQHGVLTLASIAGLSFTAGDGSADATMTFTGTANAINAALASVTYLGNANFNGADTLTLTTNDQGSTGTDPGTSGDGTSEQDQDSFTIDVGPVSDAPQGTDHTVFTNAGTGYLFALSDFGFSDPVDTPADAFTAVRITTLPLTGVLTNNGSAVTAGDFVTAADISAGLLVYTSGAGGGAGYASFQFQVQDSGTDQIGSGGFNLDQSANVMTIDVNVPPTTPTDIDGVADAVAEGAATDTLVGIIASATDTFAGTVTYSLIADSSGGGFKINATTGVVSVADGSRIDYESAPGNAYSITVQADDGLGGTSSQTFSIAVTDVAPSVPADTDGATGGSVSEGASNGATVGITASSLDVNGGTVTFALSNNAGGRFTIDSSTGVVTVANASLLDFESATSHQITVRASDPSGAFSEQSFTIDVTDVAPSAPADGNAAANTIAEGAVNGTAVAGLTIGSADVNGGAVTFALSNDAGGRFTIDSSTGMVTVANASLLDFETATSHQITVRASDPSGAFSEQSFAIDVTDVAPSAPADSNAAANTIAEGAVNGTAVAGLTIGSADVNGGTVTFALSNDAGGRFTIDSSTGAVTVANASLLDFESATSHQITVRASDPSGAFSERNFTIDLTDIAPSTPTDGNATANTIAEGAVNGTAVAGLAIGSADINGGTVTFALSNDASGRFTIDSSTGMVTVANAALLDFESSTSHQITVRASDPSGAFSEQSFAIDVTDVAPSVPADSNAAANSTAEGAVNGTAVAGLTIGSADVNGGNVTFALSNDAGGRFTIDSSTGVVTVANAALLDFESATSHQITVRASDPSGAFSEQSFTIDVIDVAPSAPADSNAAANTIAEGAVNGTAVGGLTIGSADVNGGTVTFALSNDAGGRFTVDSSTGVVTVANAALLDFESATSHQITVRASDPSGAFSEQSFTIDVTDVAPSAPADSNAAANSIAEGAVNGTAVAGLTIGSTDVNGGTVTFALSNDAGGRFIIDSSTGVVIVANAALLDFESATSHQITVRASDPSGAFSEQSFAIEVTDVAPSVPVDSNAAANSIAEGAVNGTAVAGLAIGSADINGGTVTFSLSNDAGGRFTIDSSTGVVTVANAALLDFESATSHQIAVRASDPSGAFSEQSFTIDVTDVAPSAPVDGNASANTVAEGATNGTLVSGLAIGSTDIHGGTVTYALSNDAGGRFTIDSSTGVVSVANVSLLDFETATSHQITVRAADPSGAFSEQSFAIDVTDVAPSTPADGNAAANAIAEGAVNGTAVAGLAIGSADVNGGTVTFALSNDAGGRFTIDSSTGVVTVANASLLDFESATGHQITVRASDPSGVFSEQSFTIDVTDVAPSAPADSNAAANSIAEGASNGTAVAGVAIASTDVNGGTVTFALSNDAGGRFTIDSSTGVVTVANASLLDFENATSHQVTVRASDPSGAFSEQSFTIDVTDVAPSTPTDGNAAANAIAEGAVNGTAVAGLAIGSADVNGGTVTFALSNDAGGRFTIDSSTGVVTVANASLLDFESATSHQITVRASDPSGAFSEQSFTIDVTDAAPSVPADGNAAANTIAEGVVNGAAVAGLAIGSTDVNGGTVTFSLSGDAGGRFTIDSSTGVVTVANASLLDFESATSHQITVRAADPSGAFSEQSFTIDVTDVAPSTPADSNATANTIAEGAVNGTAVAGLTIGAADVNGGTVTFSLNDDAGGRFTIDSSTGMVTVANAALLDFESVTSHQITVRAADPSGAFSEQSFVIGVTDVAPSAPIDADSASGGSVSEGASNGASVGITASSNDVNGGTVTYSLSNDASGRFTIDSSTGAVTVADAALLDFETATSHQITVRASDPSGAFSEQSFTIDVTDVAPSAPVDGNASTNTVAEGATNGTLVSGLAIGSTDIHGGTVTFALSNDAGGRFNIDPSTGVVSVADGTLIDFEVATSHQITVRASDPSGAFSEQNFTVVVTNAPPSAPTDAAGAANTIAEGAVNGTVVAGLSLISSDGAGAVTYSLSDDAGGRFAIDPVTGEVTVADASLLDFETAESHQIIVQAMDDSEAFTEQTFTIEVTDVAPSAPLDSDGATGGSISEGAGIGDSVGMAASSNDVNGGAVTYALSDDAGGRFAIDSSTGVVTVANVLLLDFESATSHQITVRASDPSSAFSEQSFTIDVTNVAPSEPVNGSLAPGSIVEGAANGTLVGGLVISSNDVNGGTVTYSLSDDAGGRFAIDPSTGAVTVADGARLDFENATSHQITVRASDPSGAFSEQTFAIEVINAPPTLPVDTDVAANAAPEGAASGTAIGLAALSSDGDATVTYSLSDDAGGRFTIDPVTGVVTVANGALLDFTAATSHQITVRAADPSGAFSEQSFTITVANVAPSAPVDVDGASGGSISEGAGNGDSANITASATDANGGTVTYSLTGDAGGRFAIDPATGVVTVADAELLDFETATSHQITVRVTDAHGAFSEQGFAIAVTDVPVSAPEDIDPAVNTVAEGAADGTVVSGLTIQASDVHGGTVTYVLTDDAGGRFAIDPVTGVVTVANGALLGLASGPYVITVEARDGSSNAIAETFTIGVEEPVEASTLASAPDYSAPALGDTPYPGFSRVLADGTYSPTGFADSGDTALTGGFPNYTMTVGGGLYIVRIDAEEEFQPTATVDGDLDFRVPMTAMIAWLGGDIVSISAKLQGDEPLPDWLKFDGTTAQFAGRMPDDVVTGSLPPVGSDPALLGGSPDPKPVTVVVTGFDTKGNRVILIFSIRPASGATGIQGALSPDLDRWADRAPAIADLLLHRMATEWPGLIRDAQPGGHTPDGRLGLSVQLGSLGSRGLAAERLALLESLRQQAAWH
jgi:hypothetical protein